MVPLFLIVTLVLCFGDRAAAAGDLSVGRQYPQQRIPAPSADVPGTIQEYVGDLLQDYGNKVAEDGNDIAEKNGVANIMITGNAHRGAAKYDRKERMARERKKLLNDLALKAHEKYEPCTNKCATTSGARTGSNAAIENDDMGKALSDTIRPALGGLRFNEQFGTFTEGQWRSLLRDPDVKKALGPNFERVSLLLEHGGSKQFADNLVAMKKEFATLIAGGGGGGGSAGGCDITGSAIAPQILKNCNIPDNAQTPEYKAMMTGMIFRMSMGTGTQSNDFYTTSANEQGRAANLVLVAGPKAESPEGMMANFELAMREAAVDGNVISAGLGDFTDNASRGDGNCQSQKKLDQGIKGIGRPGISGDAQCLSNQEIAQDGLQAMEVMAGVNSTTNPPNGARAATERDRMGEFRSVISSVGGGKVGSIARSITSVSRLAELPLRLLENKTFLAMISRQEFWTAELPPPGQRFFDIVAKQNRIVWAKLDAARAQAFMIAAAERERLRMAEQLQLNPARIAEHVDLDEQRIGQPALSSLTDMFRMASIDPATNAILFPENIAGPAMHNDPDLYTPALFKNGLKAIPIGYTPLEAGTQ